MKKEELTDIKLDGIDWDQKPRFNDAFITSAKLNGELLTDDQLEKLNDDREFVDQQVQEYLF